MGCSVLTITSFSTGETTSISENYFQVLMGAYMRIIYLLYYILSIFYYELSICGNNNLSMPWCIARRGAVLGSMGPLQRHHDHFRRVQREAVRTTRCVD